MGLDISVGMLADLLVNDEEGAKWLREDIEKLNAVLLKAGLSSHVEPAETDSASIATYGYSGLHYLRRCAVHLQYAGRLPPRWPTEQPTDDPFYIRYSDEFRDGNASLQPGDFARSSERKFDHVYMHSDAEGYYVPQRFDRVLIANGEAYGWVGSCYALAEECERLASALTLPQELLANGEDEAFTEAILDQRRSDRSDFLSNLFKPKQGAALWRAHPVAAMMCAKLHNMASHSIRTGALVVFC
ncbi:MAG: hypothetical protein M0D54_04135 [Hyphomonadaceae bacterium JAD_PAG50586_4]|nr:MAG: hypothetical protein M0D54_04135 [Hyphomonadaceae bacterium JAD_PAG50586_4]